MIKWIENKIRDWSYDSLCKGRSGKLIRSSMQLPHDLKLGEFTVNYIRDMNPCFSGSWDLCSKIPLTYLIKRNKVFTYKEANEWGIDLDYIGWGIVMTCDLSTRYKSPYALSGLIGLKPHQYVLYPLVARRLLHREDSDDILKKMELKK